MSGSLGRIWVVAGVTVAQAQSDTSILLSSHKISLPAYPLRVQMDALPWFPVTSMEATFQRVFALTSIPPDTSLLPITILSYYGGSKNEWLFFMGHYQHFLKHIPIKAGLVKWQTDGHIEEGKGDITAATLEMTISNMDSLTKLSFLKGSGLRIVFSTATIVNQETGFVEEGIPSLTQAITRNTLRQFTGEIKKGLFFAGFESHSTGWKFSDRSPDPFFYRKIGLEPPESFADSSIVLSTGVFMGVSSKTGTIRMAVRNLRRTFSIDSIPHGSLRLIEGTWKTAYRNFAFTGIISATTNSLYSINAKIAHNNFWFSYNARRIDPILTALPLPDTVLWLDTQPMHMVQAGIKLSRERFRLNLEGTGIKNLPYLSLPPRWAIANEWIFVSSMQISVSARTRESAFRMSGILNYVINAPERALSLPVFHIYSSYGFSFRASKYPLRLTLSVSLTPSWKGVYWNPITHTFWAHSAEIPVATGVSAEISLPLKHFTAFLSLVNINLWWQEPPPLLFHGTPLTGPHLRAGFFWMSRN